MRCTVRAAVFLPSHFAAPLLKTQNPAAVDVIIITFYSQTVKMTSFFRNRKPWNSRRCHLKPYIVNFALNLNHCNLFQTCTLHLRSVWCSWLKQKRCIRNAFWENPSHQSVYWSISKCETTMICSPELIVLPRRRSYRLKRGYSSSCIPQKALSK